ncbi:MAG: OmpP1/FadL family transporter [Janthinobacterium lividum]
MKHAFMGLAMSLGGFLMASQSARAQGGYANDALLYMRQNPSGTARTLGLAGAGSSLGADFGNLTSNPAGLGFFTKSEISLTPGVGFGTTGAVQASNGAAVGSSFPSLSQTANSFHIASLGLVFANRRPDSDNTSDWRGGAFALGFTRLADFNQGVSYQNSTDDNHSFFQRIREPYNNGNYTSAEYQANADDIFNQEQTGTYTNIDGLAFGTGLVDQVTVPNPGTGTAQGRNIIRLGTPAPLNPSSPDYANAPANLRNARQGTITQTENILTKGSLSQFDLGYGGNYRDRLYIGGGVGIVSLNRTRNSTFSENSGGEQDFVSTDYLKTTGTGINARLGVIVKAADFLRFGLSAQTPTYIRLTEEYSTGLTANTKYAVTGGSSSLSTAPGTFEYSVTTPFRANGGATVVLGKVGFLTGDVEYVGYSKAKFNTIDGTSDQGLNDGNYNITNNYRSVVNLRFGAEARLSVFRLRAGYAYYASPYQNNDPSYNRSQNYYSVGAGVRTKSFFLDLAGVYLDGKDQYQPYSLAYVAPPTVNLTTNRFTTSLTGGLLF